MTLVKFNRKPLNGSFSNIVDGFFNDFPELFKSNFDAPVRNGFMPPVNIKETEKEYQLEIVAPGFDKPDFKVSLDQNLLTISAEKKTENEKEKEGANESGKEIRREYSYRSFKRSFTIDEKIDATSIGATYVNGILALNLPKKETVKPVATEIKVS